MGKPASSAGRGRLLAIASTSLAAMLALGLAFVFTNSFGISQVAGHARDLHWSNASIGSAGIARASVAQAVFFSFDERLGVSSIEARDAAIAEATSNLEDLKFLLGSSDRPASLQGEAIGEPLVAAGDEILHLAASGDPDAAEQIRVGVFEPEFEQFSQTLNQQQNRLAADIDLSEQAQGRISRLTQLAVTLLIPGAAMLVFWFILRRRVRNREIEINAKLEAERQVSHAKDDLIAGLSHELRTPLTTIVGFSDLLLEGELDPVEVQEMLTIINAGSSDLSRMVDDLLVAARMDAGALSYTPKRVDLAEQAKQVIAPYVRAGDSITLRIPQIEIYADPLHLRQIMHNLVSNARRHGGDKIVVTGKTTGSTALLVVADDGPGLPEHVEANLFKRFVNRGREALLTGSVGLGLAISQELARGLGGSIQYERMGDWTTFTVRLKALPVNASRDLANARVLSPVS